MATAIQCQTGVYVCLYYTILRLATAIQYQTGVWDYNYTILRLAGLAQLSQLWRRHSFNPAFVSSSPPTTAISYLTQNKIFRHTFKLPSASVSSKGENTKQRTQGLRSVIDADLTDNVKTVQGPLSHSVDIQMTQI